MAAEFLTNQGLGQGNLFTEPFFNVYQSMHVFRTREEKHSVRFQGSILIMNFSTKKTRERMLVIGKMCFNCHRERVDGTSRLPIFS
jgi:hypothetical protein